MIVDLLNENWDKFKTFIKPIRCLVSISLSMAHIISIAITPCYK